MGGEGGRVTCWPCCERILGSFFSLCSTLVQIAFGSDVLFPIPCVFIYLSVSSLVCCVFLFYCGVRGGR